MVYLRNEYAQPLANRAELPNGTFFQPGAANARDALRVRTGPFMVTRVLVGGLQMVQWLYAATCWCCMGLRPCQHADFVCDTLLMATRSHR